MKKFILGMALVTSTTSLSTPALAANVKSSPNDLAQYTKSYKEALFNVNGEASILKEDSKSRVIGLVVRAMSLDGSARTELNLAILDKNHGLQRLEAVTVAAAAKRYSVELSRVNPEEGQALAEASDAVIGMIRNSILLGSGKPAKNLSAQELVNARSVLEALIKIIPESLLTKSSGVDQNVFIEVIKKHNELIKQYPFLTSEENFIHAIMDVNQISQEEATTVVKKFWFSSSLKAEGRNFYVNAAGQAKTDIDPIFWVKFGESYRQELSKQGFQDSVLDAFQGPNMNYRDFNSKINILPRPRKNNEVLIITNNRDILLVDKTTHEILRTFNRDNQKILERSSLQASYLENSTAFFSADGNYLISLMSNQAVTFNHYRGAKGLTGLVWSVSSGEVVGVLKRPLLIEKFGEHGQTYSRNEAIAFDMNGDVLVTLHKKSEVVAWDVRTGKILKRFSKFKIPLIHEQDYNVEALNGVSISPDGKTIYATTKSGLTTKFEM